MTLLGRIVHWSEASQLALRYQVNLKASGKDRR